MKCMNASMLQGWSGGPGAKSGANQKMVTKGTLLLGSHSAGLRSGRRWVAPQFPLSNQRMPFKNNNWRNLCAFSSLGIFRRFSLLFDYMDLVPADIFRILVVKICPNNIFCWEIQLLWNIEFKRMRPLKLWANTEPFPYPTTCEIEN